MKVKDLTWEELREQFRNKFNPNLDRYMFLLRGCPYCGVYWLSGINEIPTKESLEWLYDNLPRLKGMYFGAVQFVVHEGDKNKAQFLSWVEDLPFVSIAEYRNPAHNNRNTWLVTLTLEN